MGVWNRLLNSLGGKPMQRKSNWQNMPPPDKSQKQISPEMLEYTGKYPQETPRASQIWLNAYNSHPAVQAKKMQSLNPAMRDWVKNYYRRR